jgi:hypothetical protein
MSAIGRVACVVAWHLVVTMTPVGLAVRAPAIPSSSASSRPRPDYSTHHRGQDRPGPLVILRVRALVPDKVTLSDPTQGTVRATVLAVDEEINQIKVQTDAGQQLMLFLDPASLARLSIGAPCLLQVTNGATRDTARSPAHEAAFW